jgi:hypothetical protein
VARAVNIRAASNPIVEEARMIRAARAGTKARTRRDPAAASQRA